MCVCVLVCVCVGVCVCWCVCVLVYVCVCVVVWFLSFVIVCVLFRFQWKFAIVNPSQPVVYLSEGGRYPSSLPSLPPFPPSFLFLSLHSFVCHFELHVIAAFSFFCQN